MHRLAQTALLLLLLHICSGATSAEPPPLRVLLTPVPGEHKYYREYYRACSATQAHLKCSSCLQSTRTQVCLRQLPMS